MALEVMGLERPGLEATAVLRIRGGMFFLFSKDLWVSGGSLGIRIHASGDADQMAVKTPPVVLLAPDLEKGKVWRGTSDRAWTASVVDREPVRVPAGEFKAWKIDYVISGSGRDYHFRAWLAPGTGFVRLDSWQELHEGRERRNAESYELTRYDPERKITPLGFPALSSEDLAKAKRLIARLGQPEVAARDEGVRELAALGRGVLPVVRDQLATAKESELRGRLEAVVERFPKVEFVARNLKARGKAGQPLPLGFALRNISDSKVQILPSLGAPGRTSYPRYLLEIRDEKGDVMKPPKGPITCSFENPVEERDFITLEPGEEYDPFGAGTWGHVLLPWIAERAGTYTVQAVYDATGDVPDGWKGSATTMDPRVQRRLEAMPRRRFESNRLTIEVEP
jgi:hypothetical protein